MPVESVDFCASRCDAHARSSFFRTSHGFCDLNPSDTPHRQVRCCQAKSLESKDPTCLHEGGEPGTHTRWQVSQGVFDSINKFVDAPR